MEQKIYKPVIEKPFLRQQYTEWLRGMLIAAYSLDDVNHRQVLEKVAQMMLALKNNDYIQMEKELPEQYWAVMGSVGQIGKTSDPDDVWAEEPHCWIKPISKEEFERDDD